jgi:hypothetical protein
LVPEQLQVVQETLPGWPHHAVFCSLMLDACKSLISGIFYGEDGLIMVPLCGRVRLGSLRTVGSVETCSNELDLLVAGLTATKGAQSALGSHGTCIHGVHGHARTSIGSVDTGHVVPNSPLTGPSGDAHTTQGRQSRRGSRDILVSMSECGLRERTRLSGTGFQRGDVAIWSFVGPGWSLSR